jgi:putative transposase
MICGRRYSVGLGSTGTLACAVFPDMSYYERNLPHWHPAGKSIFLTWRVFGSLPRSVLARIASLNADPRKQFLAAERSLDGASVGPRWLAQPEIGALIVKGLEGSQELGQCVLHSWVVMPNHVHVLLDPVSSITVITRGIKGVTARNANAILGQTFLAGRVVRSLGAECSRVRTRVLLH